MTKLKITNFKVVTNFHTCCRIDFKVNGRRTSGVVFYDREIIVIHYGCARQLCLNEYNEFEGNLVEFISHNLYNAPPFTGLKDPDIGPEQLDFLGD